MLCPQGHPVPATGLAAQFCPVCGSELVNPCPVGHDNEPNARFCRECGRSMGKPTGTPPASATPPTAAVGPPTAAVAAPGTGSVGPWRPAAEPTPTGADAAAPAHRQRNRGLMIAIAVMAAAVVGVVVALMATSSGDSTTAGPAGASTTSAPPTTVPATTSTSTTLSAQALPQGQALSALLSQSSGSRSQVQAATVAIASCGDLAGARSDLVAAQSARQALLGQLGQLDLSALPGSAGLVSSLTDAWQSSAGSDGSYAEWAADEQGKTCVPDDGTDPGYQAALVADGHASTAKQQFTSLWNPVAASLGLPQWQPNQL